MANPKVTAVVYDKATYAVGELMTVAMTYSDPDTRTITGTGTVQDSAGAKGTMTTTVVLDPLQVSFTDNEGRVYTKKSDDGSVAVFTATA
jgi:hypothetical protein